MGAVRLIQENLLRHYIFRRKSNMNYCKKLRNKDIYIISIVILIFICLLSRKGIAVDKKDDHQNFEKVIYRLTNIIDRKKYSDLINIKHDSQMFWGQCNTDIGTTMSLDDMIEELYANSKNATISVNIKSGNGLIETEGWFSEYPYFYFYFTKVKNTWQWSGVCYDAKRSLDFSMYLGGKNKRYDSPPRLPRNGPRIFQDEIALRTRIEEIVRFRAFDALMPYATKNVLTFGQCNLSMMENDKVEGKNIPVQNVVDFLKQYAPSTGEIASSEMQHKTYYETTG